MITMASAWNPTSRRSYSCNVRLLSVIENWLPQARVCFFRVVDVRPVAFSAAFSASPVPAVLASTALTALPRPLGAGQRAFREALEAHGQMVPAGAVVTTAGRPRRAAPAAVPVPRRAAPRRAGRPPTCRAAPAEAADGRRRAGCPSRRACGRPARAAGTPAG
jgi:hypothetical protein